MLTRVKQVFSTAVNISVLDSLAAANGCYHFFKYIVPSSTGILDTRFLRFKDFHLFDISKLKLVLFSKNNGLVGKFIKLIVILEMVAES